MFLNMKIKKIGILAPEIHPPFIEGIQKSAWVTVKALFKRNLEIFIFTQCSFGRKLDNFKKIRIFYLISINPFKLLKYFLWVIDSFKFLALVKKNNIKNLLCFSLDLPFIVLLIPVLVFTGNLEIDLFFFSTRDITGFRKYFLLIFQKKIKRFFVLSEYLKIKLIEYHINKNKIYITTIFFTFDKKKFKELQLPSKRNFRMISYLSSIDKEAGVDIVLKLAQKMPQYRFVLAIRKFSKNKEKKIEHFLIKIKKKLIIKRNIKNTYVFLASVGGIVISPLNENFTMAIPMLLLESFITKTPVFLIKLPVFEYFHKERLVFGFSDVEELENIIREELKENNEKLQKTVERAHKYATSLLTVDDFVSKHLL